MGKRSKTNTRPNKEKVTIIVTTKNEENNIEKFWKSIKNQTYKNIECITVDNNSKDKTKELAKRYSKVLNKGPERSAQRNLGAKKATGEYLIFLDADMELTPNVISEVVEQLKDNIATIIPEKSIGKGYWQEVKTLERNCYINDYDMELPRAYKKSIFEKIGGFDENITGQEIEDLYNTAKQFGTIGRTKSFIIHHELVNSLLKIINKKYYYCLTLNRYMKKNKDVSKKQAKILFRPAYLRNWRKFLKNPLLTFGFIIMRICEGFAAIYGFYKGKKINF